VKHAFVELIYSRNMTRRFEAQVRRHPLYQELVRLIGQPATEKLLDDCPRSWRQWPR
jgi:hypothetical protein